MLPVQVSHLVCQVKVELEGDAESATMERLLRKIASLSESQLKRAQGALAMIWSYMARPSDLPAPPGSPVLEPIRNAVLPLRHPGWHLVKLAILKSISTGSFIDMQFYAHNSICKDLPVDPKPLFTSSIVIQGWGSAITNRTLEKTSSLSLPDLWLEELQGWSPMPRALWMS